MKASLFFLLLFALNALTEAQIVVTLNLPDPCASVVAVSKKPVASFNVKVYPNPTPGLLTIDLPETGGSVWKTIEVSNIMGNRIDVKKFETGNQFILDLSDRPPGIYIITLIVGEWRIHKKIIKL